MSIELLPPAPPNWPRRVVEWMGFVASHHPERQRTPSTRPITEVMGELPEELDITDPRTEELIAALFDATLRREPGTFNKDKIVSGFTWGHAVELQPSIEPGAAPEEYAVPLPPSVFTSAPGIDEWKPRKKIPRDVRKKPDTPPPIQHVLVFVFPDGTIEASLTGDGAHRLQAAMKRGDRAIYARDVTIVQLAREDEAVA